MSTFQSKPKSKSFEPAIAARGEQLRHQPPKANLARLATKQTYGGPPQQFNLNAKAVWSKTVQRFSGKRGK